MREGQVAARRVAAPAGFLHGRHLPPRPPRWTCRFNPIIPSSRRQQRRSARTSAAGGREGRTGVQLATIDIVVVIVYAIGIFGLAQFVSRERAGHKKDTSDYFLASRSLPWWAIGASLIAANISAEQIVGMSGSGYVIGLAIASYEWMAALTLLIVGKFFLPIFLRNGIYTMPQFLEQRFGPQHPHPDGGVLARPLRLREPDLDHLARLDRGQPGRRRRPGRGDRRARRLRPALPALRRPQGGGADRHRPGHPAGAWAACSSRASRSSQLGGDAGILGGLADADDRACPSIST